ncbi:1606_t:CDS:2, partial [Ambispora leptoticha]
FLAIEGSFRQMPIAFIKQIIETSGDNRQYLLILETYFLYTSDEGKTIVAELLPFVLLYSPNLRALSLGELSLEQLLSLPDYCPKLEHIDFYILSVEELTSLKQSLPPQINSLTIHGATLTNLGKYFTGFRANFLENFPFHVKYLSLFVGIDNEDEVNYIKAKTENYGIKFIKEPLHDRICPNYFPRF